MAFLAVLNGPGWAADPPAPAAPADPIPFEEVPNRITKLEEEVMRTLEAMNSVLDEEVKKDLLIFQVDAGHASRQLHILDAAGHVAAYTGEDCVDWCGHLAGDGFSITGNMLAGQGVLDDTAKAYVTNIGMPFAQRLIAAMHAGELAGGDKRGKQSAALLIYGEEEWSNLDMRVDDHIDPLAELERLEAVSRERWVHFRKYLPSRKNPAGITDRAVIDTGIAAATESKQ